jgi:hypothetical protein
MKARPTCNTPSREGNEDFVTLLARLRDQALQREPRPYDEKVERQYYMALLETIAEEEILFTNYASVLERAQRDRLLLATVDAARREDPERMRIEEELCSLIDIVRSRARGCGTSRRT